MASDYSIPSKIAYIRIKNETGKPIRTSMGFMQLFQDCLKLSSEMAPFCEKLEEDQINKIFYHFILAGESFEKDVRELGLVSENASTLDKEFSRVKGINNQFLNLLYDLRLQLGDYLYYYTEAERKQCARALCLLGNALKNNPIGQCDEQAIISLNTFLEVRLKSTGQLVNVVNKREITMEEKLRRALFLLKVLHEGLYFQPRYATVAMYHIEAACCLRYLGGESKYQYDMFRKVLLNEEYTALYSFIGDRNSFVHSVIVPFTTQAIISKVESFQKEAVLEQILCDLNKLCVKSLSSEINDRDFERLLGELHLENFASKKRRRTINNAPT